ncbi:mitogen-activated protein kinase kinase kinase 18-like [Mangifera indica]|uniref:mitogen-activated protein kinase kinase kinase 18-like n=1 Tax=Mangifera indica TaxID=29780 RepID=UPI001CFA14AB|nr:mitogen-activated protein kinase kinase kinase 18-like [Mangifera indica]
MVSWVRGKCLGRGSFGTVNIAVDRLNGNVFAVKSVDRNACHPSQVECLENEIRILRSLSSPYVVKYLGDDVSYESPTTSYRNLHLEYLPGGTVADADVATYVDEKILRSHIFCIVSALRYLHSLNIVHCDVKGKNILVGPSSSFCKLADFGSSKEIDNSGGPVLPRGSPLWMAPEVVRGEYQGPESDVWSLGCTIIEMATGRPAWEDFGGETLSRIGFSKELPIFPVQLSELGHDFVEKCLRREPSERWSCDQLLQHPFLQSVNKTVKITESSPRCVLDWVNSEFQEEEEELDYENCESSARERLGKLASSPGAIWESDGWVAVRDYEEEEEAAAAAKGTRREYPNVLGSEEPKAATGTSWVIDVRANSESKNIGGCEFGCGGESRRCNGEWQKVELAVVTGQTGIYKMCNSLLLLLCLKIFRYIINVYIYYILYPLSMASKNSIHLHVN